MSSEHSHDPAGAQPHAHDPAAAHRHGRAGEERRIVWVVGLTASILALEVAGGLLSHSLALLSDAGHMLSDVAAQVVALIALKIAARPTDQRRTYGYYRVEILAALGNGVALALLSAWILWSAWGRLHGVAAEVHTGVMIPIAALGLCANLAGAWVLHGAQSLNLRGAYLHVLTDSISSVAVIAGGAAMALAHGLYWLDPALSIAIGGFVLWSAFRLTREAVDVLLETVPAGIDPGGVSRTMAACDGVREVHDLHIWTITSGMNALSAHVVVDPADLGRSDALLGQIKARLLQEFRIAHTTIQIESHEYEHVEHTCAVPAPARAR